MNEREVQDQSNTRWKCIQAFAGSTGEAAKEATRIAEENNGAEVICTPSGGAQTVRLKLAPDWMGKMPDEELIAAIEKGR